MLEADEVEMLPQRDLHRGGGGGELPGELKFKPEAVESFPVEPKFKPEAVGRCREN